MRKTSRFSLSQWPSHLFEFFVFVVFSPCSHVHQPQAEEGVEDSGALSHSFLRKTVAMQKAISINNNHFLNITKQRISPNIIIFFFGNKTLIICSAFLRPKFVGATPTLTKHRSRSAVSAGSWEIRFGRTTPKKALKTVMKYRAPSAPDSLRPQ